jgi:hypothetical protein
MANLGFAYNDDICFLLCCSLFCISILFSAAYLFTAQALQIALVHLCFNVIGIVLFYPLPFMRWPIHMARALGDITSRYRLVKGIAS